MLSPSCSKATANAETKLNSKKCIFSFYHCLDDVFNELLRFYSRALQMDVNRRFISFTFKVYKVWFRWDIYNIFSLRLKVPIRYLSVRFVRIIGCICIVLTGRCLTEGQWAFLFVIYQLFAAIHLQIWVSLDRKYDLYCLGSLLLTYLYFDWIAFQWDQIPPGLWFSDPIPLWFKNYRTVLSFMKEVLFSLTVSD